MFGRYSVRISVEAPVILAEDFRSFLQSLLTNSGIVPQIADHSGRAVYDMNRLLPLEHWDRGSNPTQSMDIYAFILRLC